MGTFFKEAMKLQLQLILKFVFDGNFLFIISLISLFPSFETSDFYSHSLILYSDICGLQGKLTSSKLRVKEIS